MGVGVEMEEGKAKSKEAEPLLRETATTRWNCAATSSWPRVQCYTHITGPERTQAATKRVSLLSEGRKSDNC